MEQPSVSDPDPVNIRHDPKPWSSQYILYNIYYNTFVCGGRVMMVVVINNQFD